MKLNGQIHSGSCHHAVCPKGPTAESCLKKQGTEHQLTIRSLLESNSLPEITTCHPRGQHTSLQMFSVYVN